ncbi:MAG TPA: 2-C-methyl-D-erythritol 4-phosphate cytidylyltransferase [Pseudonocardiaceae bacterium]
MSVVALVPAAGRGERLGSGLPKAFVPICGEPLLRHAVRGIVRSGCVDLVVVAAPAADLGTASAVLAEFGDAVRVVGGGATRTASVRLALDAVQELDAGPDVVLVHDAARAFTPAAVFQAVVRAVRAGAGAVIPVLPLVDTVKRVDDAGRVLDTVDRATLRSVQTPQGFAPDVLRRAHAAGGDLTDDAGLVEALGLPVLAVPGDPLAFKVTTPFDLVLAEGVLRAGVAAP